MGAAGQQETNFHLRFYQYSLLLGDFLLENQTPTGNIILGVTFYLPNLNIGRTYETSENYHARLLAYLLPAHQPVRFRGFFNRATAIMK